MRSKQAEAQRRYRQRHPERIRQSRKKYRNKAKVAYRKKYPDKFKAHHAVWNAIYRKKMTKPDSCSGCNKKGLVLHGHHHKGYAKEHRLDVVWLCHDCHMKLHYQEDGAAIPTLAERKGT